MKKKDNTAYVKCYDTLYVFNNKDDAEKYFTECYYSSDGAERERYASVLIDLKFSNIAKDNVDSVCNEITIANNDLKGYINVNLNNTLTIKEAIKYYKDIIIPILKVSDDYGVDFYNKLPFEDFGSDDESFFNTSFTDYYKNILKEINIDNICTDYWSDGKYDLTVNNNRYRITAWDNLDAVIDTISTIIKEEKEKNKDECELN